MEETIKGSMKHITELSNYDMLLIFDALKSFVDRWHLAQTCKRFFAVFTTWLNKHNSLRFHVKDMLGMPLRDLIAFFDYVGPQINVLIFNSEWNEKASLIEAFIGEFCTNVESAQFVLTNNEFHYGELFKELKSLEHIEIQCLGPEDDIDHTVKIDLSENLNLRHLAIMRQGITHLQIGQLPNLRSLRFDKFTILNIKDEHNLYVTLANIKVLHLGNIATFGKLELPKILQCCFQLEELVYGITNWHLDAVTELPKLKRLTLIMHEESLSNLEALKTRFFTKLGENLGMQLVYLKLIGRMHFTCDHFTILASVRSLKSLYFSRNPLLYNNHLKFLVGLDDLETITLAECANITNESVIQILRICKNVSNISIKRCNFPSEDQVLI